MPVCPSSGGSGSGTWSGSAPGSCSTATCRPRPPEWFTTAFFHLPEELGREVAAAGLRLQTVLAVEGPAWMLPDVERRLADPARRERVLTAIRRVETEPSLLGASAHLLAVAHR
jgi:hypothetical protein